MFMKKFLQTLFLFCSPTLLWAQTGDWQQQVAYEMKINLLADQHQYKGWQRLTLTNHSPDTLHQVFYHLYFNAFQPHSMMAERNRQLPDPASRIVPRIFNLKEGEIGWHRIQFLTQNGTPVRYEIFDTVMKVFLARPILPGETAVFEMQYRSQVPLQTRRSGRDSNEGVAFSMSQWYPKLANYDERGWHTDPYVGREFYAPFGKFDVQIKAPRQFVLGGTGVLQNPDEVGHGYGIGTSKSDTLSWHFVGQNIHDFAWVADPEYVHEIAKTSTGIPIHILYQPQFKNVWQNVKTLAPAAIDRLSEQFGAYPHPQFTVAQAGDGGMEYPMVIFLAGRGLAVVHEGAHQWFYSMMGSNETDYAWMDEGFTSFATTEANTKIAGRKNPNHFHAFNGILQARKLGFYEPLSTPSDWFDSNAGYSTAAYNGGQMMAAMLGYVISDRLRDQWFLEYDKHFRFKHPEPHDLELLAEKVSGLQLDWFFDEWTYRNWKNDYAIKSLKTLPDGQTELTIVRKGRAVMPLDVEITLKDGRKQWINIPLSEMMGHKPVPTDWLVAPTWGWTSPTYTLRLSLPAKAVRAEIDPDARMLEDDRMNNVSGRWFPAVTGFMKPSPPTSTRYGQYISIFPHFSRLLGAGLGAQFHGAAPFNDHILHGQATLFTTFGADDYTVEDLGDAVSLFNYDVRYERELGQKLGDWRLKVSSDFDLGIVENQVMLTHQLTPLLRQSTRPAQSLTFGLIHSDLLRNAHFNPSPSALWDDRATLTGLLGYRMQKNRNFVSSTLEMGSTLDGIGVQSTLRLQAKAQYAWAPTPKSEQLIRLFWGIAQQNLVAQKQFVPGVSDMENQWRNDAFRVVSGTLNSNPNFYAFSGVGPVAYGYQIAPDSRLLASSLLWGYAQPLNKFKWLKPLSAYLFGGVAYENLNTRFVGDAGLDVRYNFAKLDLLKRWIPQSDVLQGMNLSLKMPFWVSHPDQLGEDHTFRFRWRLGLETDF